MSAPAGAPSISQTASMVVAPGVSTSFGSGEGAGRPSTGCGSALAISTFAAYPLSVSATSFSPAAQGAMYSWAPKPPIMPTSLSTRYHSRPVRSKMRS